MPLSPRNWQYIDPQLAFQAVNEASSYRRAAIILAEEYGMVSEYTGKMPSAMGVWQAAMRYIREDIERARQEIIEYGGEWAEDKEFYKHWLAEKSKSGIPKDSDYVEFIRENHLEEYVPEEYLYLFETAE